MGLVLTELRDESQYGTKCPLQGPYHTPWWSEGNIVLFCKEELVSIY